MKELIIPKEKAVFWMNGDGVWHNEHGPFEHPKIIRHFHNSIQKDEKGYYLCQERDEVREKVYFPYEDTAIFVFQVISGNPVQLVLNTGKSIDLDPDQLFSVDDLLYIQDKEHRIRFTQKALVAFSSWLGEENGQLVFCLDGKTYPISERHPED